MRIITLFIAPIFFNSSFLSQNNSLIKGLVTDKQTNEALPGATITYAEGKGVLSGLDGDFLFSLAEGSYLIKANLVGYKSFEQQIDLRSGDTLFLTINLESAKRAVQFFWDRESRTLLAGPEP